MLILGAFAGAGHTAQRPATGTKPLIPAAASSIASNPDAYYGQYVTVIAAVDRVISEHAFTVDQDRKASTGQDVLVLVPSLTAPVDLNAYVTVMGEVVRFPPAEISIALPAEIVSKYRGRPAILATSVLNAALVDLAKRPPPPLTPEEEAFDKVMKRVSPAFAALRQAVTDSNTEAVKLQATLLKLSFTETEAFWKTRQKADAQKWAVEARGYAEAIERAAGSARPDDLKAAVTGLQQSCSSCHATYRERLDDGSYRIRGER